MLGQNPFLLLPGVDDHPLLSGMGPRGTDPAPSPGQAGAVLKPHAQPPPWPQERSRRACASLAGRAESLLPLWQEP